MIQKLNLPARFVAGFAALLLGAAAGPAHAQAYPSRPIHVNCGFPAGGTSDVVTRILTDKLSEELKQPIVVENRVGAAGLISFTYVMKAPADGYTLLVASTSIATLPNLYRTANYDPVKDFTPIAGVAIAPFLVMVRGDFPAKNLAEFIAYAKANPGKINVGAAGTGTGDHLAGAALAERTGIKMTWIPYKGEAPAVTDLVASHVDAAFFQRGISGPYITAGKIRLLGVMAKARQPSMPDVPTTAELGYPVEAASWYGLFGPAGLPREVVELLNQRTTEALKSADVETRLNNMNQPPMIESPEQLIERIKTARDTSAAVIRYADIKVE